MTNIWRLKVMIWKILKRHKQFSKPSDEGFTIIESLMAVIVVAILMSAIAPTILLSISTRVQARRVELAADAAGSYIDGLRSGQLEPPNQTNGDLSTTNPPGVNPKPNCNKTNTYCTSNPKNQLFCIDGDNDGKCLHTSNKDFILQTFRYNPPVANGSPPRVPEDGYQLAVRVYRADAFKETGNLEKSPERQSSFTGGLGNPKIPYFETTTEIAGKDTSFSDFCDRLQGCGLP